MTHTISSNKINNVESLRISQDFVILHLTENRFGFTVDKLYSDLDHSSSGFTEDKKNYSKELSFHAVNKSLKTFIMN